jgi:ribosome recycling factor
MSIENYKEKLSKTLEYFKEEIRTLRTGRANAAQVEDLRVDYYGNPTPLKQIASINVPEARMIVVSPYDKSSLAAIEKMVTSSELGFSASNDGSVVRITIPPLNEERREDLIKIVNQKAEEAKVSMRNARREEVDEVQGKEKSGDISEDEKFKHEKEIQEKLDEYIKQIEEAETLKQQEIREV